MVAAWVQIEAATCAGVVVAVEGHEVAGDCSWKVFVDRERLTSTPTA